MVYRATLTAPVFGLRREIDRLFEDTFGRQGSTNGGVWVPVADVQEDNKDLTMSFELPGVLPADVEITAENGVLTVHGKKQEMKKESDDSRYHVVERSYGEFTRSFQLPKGLDENKIDANFDQGVLTVRIPKAALPQPKKIQIKSGQSQSGKQTETAKA